MNLKGHQYEQLTEALLHAFPTQASLTQMVKYKLSKNLNALAQGDDLQEIIFKLVEKAEAQAWTDKLVVAARESNPGNPMLVAFAQQVELTPATLIQQEGGISPVVLTGDVLERTIRRTNSFLDVDQWRTRLGEVEPQVCRIEIQTTRGEIYGTGFLVGPDALMTNYHVMEDVITGTNARPSDVTLRFDYKRLSDGRTLNPGTEFQLTAEDWLIDYSPTDKLDYALLRVRGEPGNQPVGGAGAPGAATRKWIEMSAKEYDFAAHAPLLIMQHPKGEPLKLAIDTDAIIGLYNNKTRVRYRTNTEPGSSGSPCFNSAWKLVALHHSGDLDFTPTYNEGIPIFTIAAQLEARGIRGILG